MTSAENCPHVAILAFPFGSHPAPLFALARALAAAAPTAAFSFLTSAISVTKLSKSALPENLRLCHVADGCSDEGEGPPRDVLERIGLFLKAAPGNLKVGMEAAEKEIGGVRVSCVVSDAFLWMAGEVAEEMGVPWVALWAGGTSGLVGHLYTDQLRRTIGVEEHAIHYRADEPLQIIPGLSVVRVRDLPEGIVTGVDSTFAHLLYRMAKQLPRAAAVALNTFEGLDPAFDAELKSKFKMSLPVGPLNLLSPSPSEPDNSQCLSWLDHQGPATVAFISFGMIASLPPSELGELAQGLEASGAPFIWSLRDKEALPAGFLDRTRGRGLVVAWAPQVRVLGHRAVGVFVTHCGWNSVMESVAAGVPMVCRPFFGDHMMAERVASHVWEVGLGFEGGVITREEMARALNKVLREEEGKKMRERSCKLKTQAVQAVGPGGSSAKNFNTLLEIVCGNG